MKKLICEAVVFGHKKAGLAIIMDRAIQAIQMACQ